MSAKFFTKMLATGAIVFSSIVTMSQPSSAQTTTYFCGTSRDGIPTTFARTATGRKIAVIRWEKQWSKKYPPRARCQEVSRRFQKASEDEVLNYLTMGRINDQNVLCAASRYGDSCSPEYLLLTLRPEEDPSVFIENLRQLGSVASGPLIQSEDGSPRIFLDMNQLIRKASSDQN